MNMSRLILLTISICWSIQIVAQTQNEKGIPKIAFSSNNSMDHGQNQHRSTPDAQFASFQNQDLVEINAAPNPFIESFHLSNIPNNITSYAIYNRKGQLVQEGEKNKKHMSVRMANSPTGVYYLNLFDNERLVANQKLIKK